MAEISPKRQRNGEQKLKQISCWNKREKPTESSDRRQWASITTPTLSDNRTGVISASTWSSLLTDSVGLVRFRQLGAMDPSSTSSVLELAAAADPETGSVMATETDASRVAEHRGYAEALSPPGRSNKREGRSNRRSCGTREILSASAIFFALLLVVGAIFMHLRHKHHLGRLHIHLRDHAEHLPLVAAAGVAAQTITTFRPAIALSPSPYPPTSTPSPPPWQLSDECLACMAIAATDNIPGVCRSKGRGELQCGIYRISLGYWQDAQRLIDPMDTLAKDYEGCVVDDGCAGRIVRSYVQRYAFDCNENGRIECRDHAILHMRGPSGCRRHEVLTSPIEKRLEVCLKYKEIS